MFKKSEDHSQLDMFSSPTEHFSASRKKKYLKNDSWHNLVEYAGEHGEDLLKKCQEQTTRDQALEFNVSGRQVRMDSKLIGSNIAWYSRYELVHETLRLFIAEREEHIFKKSLREEELSLIKSIQSETGDKMIYRSTKAEVDARFVALGKLMYRFIGLFKRYDYGQYKTLKTVFGQQYPISGGNKVKGYSANMTETCDRAREGQAPVLNLVTDTRVDVVSTPDNSFLQPALEQTGEIVTGTIEKVYADGAYNSIENREYCQNDGHGIDLLLIAMQGAAPRYDIKLDGQDKNNLIVTDNKTGITVHKQPVKPRKDKTQKKWKIKTETGAYRYFDADSLRTAALRQKLKDIPIEGKNIRNNVEAGIFQSGYHYPNDKSRYRTLAKHKLWAYSRSMWINFVRTVNYCVKPYGQSQACLNYAVASNSLTLVNHITRICQRPHFWQKTPQYVVKLYSDMYIIVNTLLTKKIIQISPEYRNFSTFWKMVLGVNSYLL